MEINSLIVTSFVLGVVLFRLALIDIRTLRLPDVYTLPLVLAGILVNGIMVGGLPHGAIWGALTGYISFWALGTIAYLQKGQEGLGLGDAKLFAAAGAWVGIGLLPFVLFFAAGGALITLLFRDVSTKDHVAFGPWLAAALWVFWTSKVLFGTILQ